MSSERQHVSIVEQYSLYVSLWERKIMWLW